jgi:hypothetical protein
MLLFIHTVTKSTADDKRGLLLLAVCFRLAADTRAHGEGERGLPPLLACQLSPLHAAAERAAPLPGVQECFPLPGRFLVYLYKRRYLYIRQRCRAGVGAARSGKLVVRAGAGAGFFKFFRLLFRVKLKYR